MSNDLVKASDVNIDELKRLGIMLATSGYFEANAKADVAVAQMCVKVLAGRELGFGPFASVNGIHVIKGKPAVSANLMAAAVKGNPRYDYRVRQMDDDGVTLEFFEIANSKRESLGVSSFTRDDARKAGTQNMDKFGRNMMFARAMSNGVKWFCPDVFDGNVVYVPEELGATVDGDGNVIDVDYSTVDQATGEIKPPATPYTNGATNGHTPPPVAPKPVAQLTPTEVPDEIAAWQKPEDAYEWAVSIGASDNVFAARNAMKSIVDAHGGRFTRDNAAEIYTAYYHERRARALEKAKQALEELDMAAVPEIDPDGVFA